MEAVNCGLRHLGDEGKVWVWHCGSQLMERSLDSQDKEQARAFPLEKHPQAEKYGPRPTSPSRSKMCWQ